MDEAQKQYLDQTYSVNLPNKAEPVTVNEYALRVGNRIYRLEDISRHGVAIVMPNYAPGILLLALGIIFVATGILNGRYIYTYLPQTTFLYDYIPALPPLFDITLSKFELLTGIGAVLCLNGLISLIVIRKRYVLRIVMGAEEMTVFTSRSKIQLIEIANALGNRLNKNESGQRRKVREHSHAY